MKELCLIWPLTKHANDCPTSNPYFDIRLGAITLPIYKGLI